MRVYQSVIFVLESSICFRTALAFLNDDVTFTHRKLLDQRNNTLIIGSLLGGNDTYTLSKEIFECTISLINDHSDGWYDDLLKDINISYRIEDANCNESATIHSYENIRDIIDVVIGPMCSASAMASGWLTTEDKKVQVSHAASSVRLSDKEEFPYVSRLVAPDNENGEVGALVAALKGFGWNRVSVIYTDSPFANDYVKEFTKIWTNRSISNETYLSSSQKITLLENDMLDKDSGRKAITNLMDLKISEKARVILLVAYLGEAKSILELAKDMNFQPDTIWVAVSTWCDMELPQAIQLNSGKHPGYIGVTPFRNRDSRYQVYWERFQSRCNEENRTELPDYYSENLVDAIVAALLAFNSTPRRLWKNATQLTKNLRALDYDGVSGRVSFTREGDRENPLFSIYNLQLNEDEKFEWKLIGNVEKNGNFTIDETKDICFAGTFGCNKQKKFPTDKYPQDVEWWVFALSGLCVLFALALFSSLLFWVKWLRSNHSILEMNKRIESLRKLNREISTLDKGKKSDRSRRQELFHRRDTLTDAPPVTWSDSSESILVEVQPHEEQYTKVLEKLRQGMNDANISKLWRVQNISLWTYYSFHKLRLTINDIDHNEKDVWHGTSDIDPAVIYNDTQDGFMMQFARSGSWGRGLYFAAESEYSHKFAFNPQDGLRVNMQSWNERPLGLEGERELFLTRLLVGNEITMDRFESESMMRKCQNLTVPPTDPQTRQKYNSVKGEARYKTYLGETLRSKVWIVYENGRAYPDFLVRYYRGPRRLSQTTHKGEHVEVKDIAPEEESEHGSEMSFADLE